MIDALMYFIFWLLGLILGTQMIASWYSLRDFLYRLKRFYRTALWRTLLWTLICWAVYRLLGHQNSDAFADGVVFIFYTHIFFMLVPNLLLWLIHKEYQSRYGKLLGKLKSGQKLTL